MLCSVSIGKSGKTWLDRLRSGKGFTEADNLDLDLDHFLHNRNEDDNANPVLSHSNSKSDDSRLTCLRQATEEICSESRDKEWFNIITSALSGLFNMGHPNQNPDFTTKKAPRKQPNPKLCVRSIPATEKIEPNCSRKDENVPATTASSLNSHNNSNVGTKEEKSTIGSVDCEGDYDVPEAAEEEEEDERKEKFNGDKELKGYSRSEVTVIDTSCEVWKFDKLVFRKKNVWKVRDKRVRSLVGSNKKRKKLEMSPRDGNGTFVPKKRAKLLNQEMGCSNVVAAGDLAPSSNCLKPLLEKLEQVCKETPNDIGQFSKMRSPRKLKKSSSSVVLIKVASRSNKCVRNIPKSGVREHKT
ncbi:hypothetical protein K2173_021830 [Erythroxylum novogranatense]|uniref:Uncharacterized protein n=1 Tax=Erythroxylum novogranatense TaxID=1862640 RepID=A0AAV8T207_9ROSI|nr:hypothetical protein K2173_021830 [Erythroxylum novogranatense]